METVFPKKDETGFDSLFIVGKRKKNESDFEDTGTVILKRSYSIDDGTGVLTPITGEDSGALLLKDEQAPDKTITHEHDMAPFKPVGDIVVLNFIPVVDPAGTLINLLINNIPWLTRTLFDNSYHDLFGWQDRSSEIRLPDGAIDDVTFELTSNFENTFFNGYLREAWRAPSPYLTGSENLIIERNNLIDYEFSLPGENPSAVLFTYEIMPDEESNWNQFPITMKLDTLVVEPEQNQCYIVWRGVWPFKNHDEGAYRKLVVNV